MKPTEMSLLKEFVSSRNFLMGQIADLAEENGEIYKARAWRWIKDYEKYPSKRTVKRRWKDTVIRYGWALTQKNETLISAALAGPSVLPYDIYIFKYMDTVPRWETPEYALEAAANALAMYMEGLDEHQKVLDEQRKRLISEGII